MKSQLIHTPKGKIILNQLEDQGLSKREMQSFVVEYIQKEQGLQLRHDSNGKPFLLGENTANISISYALNWFAIYLSKTEEVGIDIEFSSTKILKILDLFLTDAEKILFPNMSTEILHLIWCAKETIFKLYGGTFEDLKNEVEISGINLEEKSIQVQSRFGITRCHFENDKNQFFLVYT